MITEHAIKRCTERIKNNSYRKNKKANMKKIMKRDAYERYFAYLETKDKCFRYVNKNGIVYKYILNKFTNKIITVYQVDFNLELFNYPHIRIKDR